MFRPRGCGRLVGAGGGSLVSGHPLPTAEILSLQPSPFAGGWIPVGGAYVCRCCLLHS